MKLFLQENGNTLVQCLFLCFLCVSAYTDSQENKIPIITGFITLFLIGFIRIFQNGDNTEYIAVALILGIVYYLQALLVTGSGGDIVLMFALGFATGLTGSVFAIIFSGIFLLFYIIIVKLRNRKEKIWEKEYPVAPFVLFGYGCFLIFRLYHFIDIDMWKIVLSVINLKNGGIL